MIFWVKCCLHRIFREKYYHPIARLVVEIERLLYDNREITALLRGVIRVHASSIIMTSSCRANVAMTLRPMVARAPCVARVRMPRKFRKFRNLDRRYYLELHFRRRVTMPRETGNISDPFARMANRSRREPCALGTSGTCFLKSALHNQVF